MSKGTLTMKTLYHLCQGGSAAAMLRAALSDPVIDILDDGAIGPLADVDTDSPDARVRFMKALFASGGFDAQDTDAMDWYGELRDMNSRFANLAKLAADDAEVVIWAEAHEVEQALRRRAHWWLRASAVAVSEIGASLRDRTRAAQDESSALDPAHARALIDQRTPASAELRANLAREWTALAQHGDALRVWENGTLASYPIDHYDAAFAALGTPAPVKLASADVLGAAMHLSRRSDLFCKWRYGVLIGQRKIVVTAGDPRDPASLEVRALA
jgi:hypothetical protein